MDDEQQAVVGNAPKLNFVFDADKGGAGDLIAMSWVAKGIEAVGGRCAFHAVRDDYQPLVRLLGVEVAPGPAPDGTVQTGARFPPYTYELTVDRGKTNRVALWTDMLAAGVKPVRPVLSYRPEVVEAMKKSSRDRAGGKPLVLLFPFSWYKPRSWPMPYWLDLYQWLEGKGVSPAFVGDGGSMRNMPVGPYKYWGFTWDRVAALMGESAMVLCNDSGPAWLAGTVGVPTLALMGPTSNIFTGMPSVEEVHADPRDVACVKCHFQGEGGFRMACDAGCQALFAVKPLTVLEKVLRKLGIEQ